MTLRTTLLRLRRLAHAIDGERESKPADVARRMLAVQAQDFAAGSWALAVRTTHATRTDVLTDLDAGRVVRSWPMRGTLHFVPGEDLRWMLSITTARMVAGLTARHRQLELDAVELGRARDIVGSALVGGKNITRAELLDLWERNGIQTAGQRGYHLIYYLAQTGLICWGPTLRTQQTLVLLDEWVPPSRQLEPDEAWAEFLLRYLHGHGPATIKDFVWWSKGTVAGAKTALAVLGDTITTLESDGIEYLVTTELLDRADGLTETRREREAVVLLPAFDEYLLGYRDRRPVLDDEHVDSIVPGRNGIFQPIIVTRGRVVGTWRRGTSGGPVEILPFTALPAGRQRTAAAAGAAYGRYNA